MNNRKRNTLRCCGKENNEQIIETNSPIFGSIDASSKSSGSN